MDTRTCQCQFDGEETLCIASFIWSQAHLRLYISWEMQRREDWTWSYSTSTISQNTQPSEDIQSCFAGWCPAALCRACCQAERTEDPAWVCHYEGFNCEDVTCEQDVNLGASQGLKEDWKSVTDRVFQLFSFRRLQDLCICTEGGVHWTLKFGFSPTARNAYDAIVWTYLVDLVVFNLGSELCDESKVILASA